MKLIPSLLLLGTAAASSAHTTIGQSLRILHSNPEIARQLQFSLDDLGGCPDTCSSPEICSFYESQAAGDLDTSSENLQVIQDACDAGTLTECAPSILSGVCGLCDGGGGLLAAFVPAEDLEMICTSCEFLVCCDGGEGFDVCGEKLPGELLAGGSGTSSTSAASTTSAASSTQTAATEAATDTTPANEDSSSTSTTAAETTTSTETDDNLVEEAELLNATGSGIDDFLEGLLGDGSNASTGDFFEGIFGEFNDTEDDDFWGGMFEGHGGMHEEDGHGPWGGMFGAGSDETGSDDFFGSIGDFIGGIFGGGDTGDMNYTYDDDWDLSSVFNESGDDFLGSIFGGELNETSDSGLSDMLGGLIEVVGGLFGNMMGENETDWIDKGNMSEWYHDDMMFGSSMMCSEDSSCPVEGFCECMSGDLSKCSLKLMDDVCSSGAAFSCAPEGFEEMCNNECPPPPRRLQGQGPFAVSGNSSSFAVQSETESYSAPNCMMCSIARCCESEGATMNQCAMEAGIDPQAVMMNLTDIGEILGDFVNEIIENVTGVLDELIGNVSIPEFCPTGQCPVDGFCECFQGDFMECNEQVMRDACEQDAFFGECGPENFQDFCSNECNGEVESMQDMVNMALCSMCTIATCCHEQRSPDECIFAGPTFPTSTAPPAELTTDTSGTYEGAESDTTLEEETAVDESEDQSEENSGAEGTSGNDEAESSFASATAQDDESSGVSLHSALFCASATVSTLLYLI